MTARFPALAWLTLALTFIGCGPDPEARIAGPWAVDAERWLADPSLAPLPEPVRDALEPIARGQAAALRFRFGDGRCERRVASRDASTPCAMHDVEQGTVVLRATTDSGVPDWIRIRPDGDRAQLTWGDRTLPLRRVEAPGREASLDSPPPRN